MGSDNQFHKRKAKQLEDLKRRERRRSQYERILVVCEGSKTEPVYFRALVDEYKLNTTNVEITGDCGSSPINVVNHALALYREEKKSGGIYDRVYCVFDKDNHDSYQQAIDKINCLRPKNTFIAIKSVPCFEYWLLQHFIYSTQEFTKAGNKSPCDSLIAELKKHIPSYRKGGINSKILKILLANTQQAIHNSKQSKQAAEDTGNDNPSTEVHILVEYFLELKNK